MSETTTAPKATRKPRDPNAPKRVVTPKPAYIIFQMLDAEGNPVAFDKSRIRVVKGTKSAAEALELIEGTGLAHATYLRTMVEGR
jgi:hypothetical protein